MKMLFLSLCSFVGLMATVATAQNLAVVDVQGVFNASSAAQEASDHLKEKMLEAERRIKKLEQPLIDASRDLEGKRDTMSAEAFLTEQRALREQIMEKGAQAQDIQKRFDRQQLDLRKQILDEIKNIVADMARAEGYAMVLPKATAIYADSSADISSAVLDRLNKQLRKLDY